jgi:hypothetical protein
MWKRYRSFQDRIIQYWTHFHEYVAIAYVYYLRYTRWRLQVYSCNHKILWMFTKR